MTTDLFANEYHWNTTSGGTTAPVAGTSENLTVSNPAGAPDASAAAGTVFRIVDLADTNTPPEIMVVTNVAGGTWTITRAAEGPTQPWAHAAGWVAVPVLTQAALQSIAGGSSGGSAGASTIFTQNGVTIAAGSTQNLSVAVPAGVQSVAVLFNTATATTAEFVTLKHLMSAPVQIDEATYSEQWLPTTGGNNFPAARYNVVPGQTCTLQINNMGAVSVTGNVQIIGYAVPASVTVPKQIMAPRWAWLGWEDSNLAASPTPVSFLVPITADMFLLGMEIDLAFAIGNGATVNYFWTGSGSGGFWRAKDGAPWALNVSQATPTGPASAGFGTPTKDTPVGFGPLSTGAFDNTFFTSTMKNSGPSIAPASNRHVSLNFADRQTGRGILLKNGDGLWFHMAGGVGTSGTAGTLDGEMQLAIKYALA